MSRKSVSFGSLLDYINREAAASHVSFANEAASITAILHNLKSPSADPKKIEGEFLHNYRYLPPRKNGVVLYHEVLSFSVHDKAKISAEMVLDLGREYLQLRAPEALAYARVHLDKDTIHLHLMISANLIGSRKKLRLTKKKFNQVKHELEAIQRERYPELANSLVFAAKEKKLGRRLSSFRRKGRGEAERERRQRRSGRKKPTEKERVIEIFREHLWVSSSEDDFKRRIGEECLSFYVRGRTIGLLDGRTGRKYRLKTLGLLGDLEKAREGWRRLPKFKASLETFERRKQLREFSELGFKKDILEVLTWRQDESEPPEVKRRKAELRRVARLQRELRRGVGERAKSR